LREQTRAGFYLGARESEGCGEEWLWEKGAVEPELKWMPAIIAFLGCDPRSQAQTLGEPVRSDRVRPEWR